MPSPVPAGAAQAAVIDLTGADPCKALSMDQLRELDYDRGYDRPPGATKDQFHGGPQCAFSSRARKFDSRITLSTTENFDRWRTDPARTATNVATGITIDGLPGLKVTNTVLFDQCHAVVGTSDNQYIDVRSSASVKPETNTPDIYCAEAQRVAEMVLRTLKASK